MNKQSAAIMLAVVVVILISFNGALSAPAEITEEQDIAGIAQRLKRVVIPSALEKLIYNAEHDHDELDDGADLDEIFACNDLDAEIRILLKNDDEKVKRVVVARQACNYGPHTYNKWARGEELYPESVFDKESEELMDPGYFILS